MKIKCIFAHHSLTLTINKMYEVKRVSKYSYLVENDDGTMRLYLKEHFEKEGAI